MRKKKEAHEVGEVLAYANGLLVGDMCKRDLTSTNDDQAVEAYREKWFKKLATDDSGQLFESAFNRGFDRSLDPPLPKGKIGRRLNDNAIAVAEQVGMQARTIGGMLMVLGKMEPRMQREVIEACSRLLRDLDERLASAAGIPNLPPDDG